jgi:hypothetical protein
VLHFGRTPSHYLLGYHPLRINSRFRTNLGLSLPAAFTCYRCDFATRSPQSVSAGNWRRMLPSSICKRASQSLSRSKWGFVIYGCAPSLRSNHKSRLGGIDVELLLTPFPFGRILAAISSAFSCCELRHLWFPISSPQISFGCGTPKTYCLVIGGIQPSGATRDTCDTATPGSEPKKPAALLDRKSRSEESHVGV